MLRRILATLLLTLLLATPVLADGPRDERQERREEMRERWQALNQTQQELGLARAEAHGLFARLAYDNATGEARGGFLRFHVQASAGAIHDVRVRANRTLPLTPLFAGVAPDAFTLQGGPAVHGAVLALDGAQVDFRAHNNPTAGLTWRANATTTLTFTLAPGVGVLTNDTHEVKLSVGSTHAHIVANSATPVRVAGATVTVALATGDSAMVRVHPVGDASGGGLHDLIAAFKAHRLGATLRVTDAGGAAVEDGEGADVHASTRSIARGRVVWDISSAQHAGRVLFFTLDNGTLDPARLEQAVATLDGTPLRRLGTPADVVAASDGAFALLASADRRSVTLAVAVPHFSSYALALTQPVAAGTGTTAATTSATAGAGSPAGSSGQTSGSGATQGSPAPVAGALLALGLALLAARRRA